VLLSVAMLLQLYPEARQVLLAERTLDALVFLP
jgi:hypothetical protein